jgi:hypothetical protein
MAEQTMRCGVPPITGRDESVVRSIAVGPVRGMLAGAQASRRRAEKGGRIRKEGPDRRDGE